MNFQRWKQTRQKSLVSKENYQYSWFMNLKEKTAWKPNIFWDDQSCRYETGSFMDNRSGKIQLLTLRELLKGQPKDRECTQAAFAISFSKFIITIDMDSALFRLLLIVGTLQLYTPALLWSRISHRCRCSLLSGHDGKRKSPARCNSAFPGQSCPMLLELQFLLVRRLNQIVTWSKSERNYFCSLQWATASYHYRQICTPLNFDGRDHLIVLIPNRYS